MARRDRRNTIFFHLCILLLGWALITPAGATPAPSTQTAPAPSDTIIVARSTEGGISGVDPLPDVAANSDGFFAVVWRAPGTVTAEIFDSSSPPPFPGTTIILTDSALGLPTVAVDFAFDDWVAVWIEGTSTSTQLVAQRFDLDGTIGSPVEIAETEPNCMPFLGGDCLLANPAVVARDDGSFVAAWDQGRGDDGGHQIFGRHYDDQNEPTGPRFLIADDSTDSSLTPAITLDDAGDLLTALRRAVAPTNTTPADGADEIRLARTTTAGTPLDEVPVNLYLPGSQRQPALTLLPDAGSGVVLWTDESPDVTTGEGIWSRAVDDTPTGAEYQVNATVIGRQSAPAVAADPEAGFAVVWHDNLDGAGDAIRVQRFDTPGVFVDGQLTIAEDDERTYGRPRIDSLGEQRYVAVWGSPATLDNPTNVTFIAPLGPTPGSACLTDPESLCLAESRFLVTARWWTENGETGHAEAVTLSSDSGYFWFFDRDNVELAVKVLEACHPATPCHWVFAAGLTTLGVELTITDRVTERSVTYTNPAGSRFTPRIDTATFSPTPRPNPRRGVERPTAPAPVVRSDSCGALCLGDRFAVEVTWRTPVGETGTGVPVSLGRDAGYVWFFGPDNLEVLVKVLDGCAVGGHHWVFAAGLTNLEVTLTVTDTSTGISRQYIHAGGSAFETVADTTSFTCR